MKKFPLLLCLLLILSGIFSIIGFAANDSIQILKIGLYYPTEKVDGSNQSVLISNNQGFELGELVDDAYVKHFNLPGFTSFKFMVDQGYHAIIGPLDSYDQAKIVQEQIGQEAFLVKGQAYYVYSRALGSLEEAQALEVDFKAYGQTTAAVQADNQLILIQGDRTYGGFLADEGDFIVCPLNSGLLGAHSLVDDHNYRGGFGVKNQYLKGISLINYVTMQEYLYGVVPREMSRTWPIEALKAQAVVARNFAVANQNKFMDYGFNLDNTILSQVYAGFDWEGDLSNQAVDDTAGLLLYHGDILVSGYYHSNSGGYTENSENVWSAELPYIKGVYDPFSTEDNFELVYTPDMIEKRLSEKGYSLGQLEDFYISDYTDNNRVLNARFVGSSGQVDLPKETIRKVFGYNEVRSTLLIVTPDNAMRLTDGMTFEDKAPKQMTVLGADGKLTTVTTDLVVTDGSTTKVFDYASTSYKVNGSGWGHGLGMSQWGAKTMAEQGFTFDKILTFYYQGTHLE